MSRDDDNPLHRLAARYGIEITHKDMWGAEHAVPRDTICALLAAMGVSATSEREIAEAIDADEAARWRHPLPPVVVAAAGRLAVELVLPCELAAKHLRWSIVTEDGERHEGAVQLSELTVTGEGFCKSDAYQRRRLAPATDLPLGYHRLSVAADRGPLQAETQLIVAPDRCYEPSDATAGAAVWGIAVQLYGLRSERDWGMGDFHELGDFAARAARLGADTVGLNPLHALFPADPGHFSPYGPSSRRFLNVLYIDPTAVPELAECAGARALLGNDAFRQRLEAARRADLVDYPAVSALKMPVLRTLYQCFRERHLGPEPDSRGQAFRAFQDRGGRDMEKHAIFHALHEHFFLRDTDKWFWRTWPAALQDHDSAEVARFAEAHRDRVEFFQYLQWIAEEQLAAAQRRARQAGMAIGLYGDLAVADHPGGSTAWCHPDIVLTDARIGAPPDLFNAAGQAWGLAALSPRGLFEAAYRPFVDDLRANMRHAGALRIDHAMALRRLFWIPAGASPADGAYVRYPLRDLSRLVALESQRNACAVIGEDLGTVPKGFRSEMEHAGMQSYRVLWFEKDAMGELLPPAAYPSNALVTPSTHDLPPLRGFWTGRDLYWRERVGHLATAEAVASAKAERRRDRQALLRALQRQGLLPASMDPETPPDDMPAALVEAVYRFLAQTPGAILMVQSEDVLGEVEQPNLPGTVEGHPNWRRRLGKTNTALLALPMASRLADAIREARLPIAR